MDMVLIIASGIVIIVWLWIKIYCVFFEIDRRLSILELDLEILNTDKKIEED